MEQSRLNVPLTLEMDYGVPSRLFQGHIVSIGLENRGGGIKAFSNYLILSFIIAFPFSISPTDIFRAHPIAS